MAASGTRVIVVLTVPTLDQTAGHAFGLAPDCISHFYF
jgi:hypothetical protein